jgi:hypothetical protein
MCLSADRVGDENIDCLGAADELQFCRTHTVSSTGYSPFRCLNDTECVTYDHLCNKYQDCPLNDDETFCGDQYRICDNNNLSDPPNANDALCRMQILDKIQFSLKTSRTYPLPENKTIVRITDEPVKRHTTNIVNNIKSEPNDPSWAWRCHYGLYARHWLGGNNFSFVCFCPPNYYGNTCQYQSQRVSLTLKLRVVGPHGIYAMLVTLIDDDGDRQEINSYHQSSYVPTYSFKAAINFHLLYLTRPKNSSKNFSIRIDAFDKISLTYIASWYSKIHFPFLPVNRLAMLLAVPTQQAPSLKYCPLTCHNGECMKYTNDEKFFCRCHTGWYGARCHIPVHCSDCSSDSVCVGSIHNRSICVCPVNKFGSRCFRVGTGQVFCIRSGPAGLKTCPVRSGLNPAGSSLKSNWQKSGKNNEPKRSVLTENNG